MKCVTVSTARRLGQTVGMTCLLAVVASDNGAHAADPITRPDILAISISESKIRIDFEWKSQPVFPIYSGSTTALEFEVRICPKCFIEPNWSPVAPGKDYFMGPPLSLVDTNLPLNNWYVDVFNYTLPSSAAETWKIVRDSCTFIAPGLFDTLVETLPLIDLTYYSALKEGLNRQGNFAIGIYDASKLVPNKSYYAELKVRNVRPECGHGYAWIRAQAAPSTCSIGPIDVDRCPYFIGADICDGTTHNRVWAARICGPTGRTEVPQSAHYSTCVSFDFDNCQNSPTAPVPACVAWCYDGDADGWFAEQSAQMFSTEYPDCNDDPNSNGSSTQKCAPGCNDASCSASETCETCPRDCNCPTCHDGIKNQSEQGVDCGGPCPACSTPPSCSDHIRNQGEQQTDCGGPCPPCTTCPNGVCDASETCSGCPSDCCLATPQLTSPTSGTSFLTSEDIAFKWQPVTGGKRYRFAICYDDAISTNCPYIIDWLDDGVTTYSIPASGIGVGTWYWSAGALATTESQGWSPYRKPAHFFMIGSPSCAPNCAGKSCGPNGCGGSCGVCGAGATCDLGTWTCIPSTSGVDECESGSCCNTTTGQFAGSGVPCGEQTTAFVCSAQCAGTLSVQTYQDYCTGDSAACTPELRQLVDDTAVHTCDCGQRCDADEGACLYAMSCTGSFPSKHPEATLIRSLSSPKTYIIEGGVKRHLWSAEGEGPGYSYDVNDYFTIGWDVVVSDAELNSYPEGTPYKFSSEYSNMHAALFLCPANGATCTQGKTYLVYRGWGFGSQFKFQEIPSSSTDVYKASWHLDAIDTADLSVIASPASGFAPLRPSTPFRWQSKFYVAGWGRTAYRLNLTEAELGEVGYIVGDFITVASSVPIASICNIEDLYLEDFGEYCDSSSSDWHYGSGGISLAGGEGCYTGLSSTRGRGSCRDGLASWGSGEFRCVGEVLPIPETCSNSADDDCDGATDGVDAQDCPAPAGPSDADGDGSNDNDDCDDQNFAVHPGAPESCNGVDDDCDDSTDENFANLNAACDGPDADKCPKGTWTCNTAGTSTWCTNEVLVDIPEVCDGVDNDCDGGTDEGLLNRCGVCGLEPAEICDTIDNDCDGTTDEEVKNACGACGPIPPEACGNSSDDDCDGSTDEGCGACATEGAVCDDGVACTTNDRCSGGACAGTPDLTRCTPSGQCFSASCTASGCVNSPRSGPCDDGNSCTTSDACSGGLCRGSPLDCETGGVEQESCGECDEGTRSRTCSACSWGAWSTCEGQRCAPGTSQACTNEFGSGTKLCSNECNWSSCSAGPAVYLTEDKSSVSFRISVLACNDGTPLTSLEAAGNLCIQWFALGSSFDMREDRLTDSDNDGIVTAVIPPIRDGDRPYAGCCPGGLPLRFNLKQCGWGSEDAKWMHMVPGQPKYGDFVMLGTDTRCICTASLAISRDATIGHWASGSSLSYECDTSLCGPDYPMHSVTVHFESSVSIEGIASSDLCSGPLQAWESEPYFVPYENTCTDVIPGLHRIQFQLTDINDHTWAAGEPVPGEPRAPYGSPTVTVDGVSTPVILAHDWRMDWGANFFVCLGPEPCEFCCDDIDNDQDGYIDIDDTDCWDLEWCPPSSSPCGDSTCQLDEDCYSCPGDCGACPSYCGPPSGDCYPFETTVAAGPASAEITWWNSSGTALSPTVVPATGGTYASPVGACAVSLWPSDSRAGSCYLCATGREQDFCPLPGGGVGCAMNGACAD